MDRNDIHKEYTNGEVVIVWQPGKCMHSTICFNGLPGVFDPRKRPWIRAEGAETEAIIEQVKHCPSGALSYYMKDNKKEEELLQVETVIEAMENGPLLVYGTVKVRDKDGNETIKNKTTAFCRCGGSQNKPYCDGTHRKIGFEG